MAMDDTQRDIKWHRTKLPAETLKKLNERSDAKAWLQTGGYLGLIVATGAFSYYAWSVQNWWLLALGLFLHGTVCAFNINAVHELVHGTVFKTSWLNEFFCHLFGFIGWNNNRFFWYSHTEHHKFTLHPPADLEVTVPQYHSVQGWLSGAILNYYGLKTMMTNIRYALGKLKGPWEPMVLPEEAETRRKNVFNWARTIILGHLLITGVSLYYGLWIIPVIVSLTPLYGAWLFMLCNNTQHAGLVESVNDFRLNCRTFYVNPIVEFLYWRMNWHIEHHMYAAVPCYNLRKLHEAIKHELPHCPNGLLETWVEIGYIMYRQKKDPDYRFLAQLPNEDNSLTSKSRLQQIREQADRHASTGSVSEPVGQGRRWECRICGFIYDEAKGLPEEGIQPGTAWDDIPDDWSCPDCGVSKAEFDMVEITGRAATSATKNDAPASEEAKPVVILGSGLAGYGLARELRKVSPNRPVTVLTRDGGEAYSKPALSNALATGKKPQALPSASAQEMEAQLGITVKTRVSVSSIDREQRIAVTDQGEVPYSDLVLALGADPIRLPLKGDAADEVLSVNDLDDYARFRKKLPARGHVTILGAGLIGCEFANDLFASGHKVSVIDLADRPLGRLFPEEFGRALKDEFTEEGDVDWHLADSVQEVSKHGEKYAVTLDKSGKCLETDVVLSAIGLKPRIALAEAAGLKVNRGIVVDALLRTNDEHIYALGDCAEVSGTVLPFIMPIMTQIRALAQTLSGKEAHVEYPLMPVVVKTPECPLVIALPSHPIEDASWELAGSAPNYEARYLDKDGRLVGFALSGDVANQRQDWLKRVEKAAQVELLN